MKDAIEALPQVKKPLQIIVHPEDASIVTKYLKNEFAELGISVISNQNVERGGCIVETPHNTVDATNSVRWRIISNALGHDVAWSE